MRYRNYGEPSTENTSLAAYVEHIRGSDEPKITKLSIARTIAKKRASETQTDVDICWDADRGQYRLFNRHAGNRNVVETIYCR